MSGWIKHFVLDRIAFIALFAFCLLLYVLSVVQSRVSHPALGGRKPLRLQEGALGKQTDAVSHSARAGND